MQYSFLARCPTQTLDRRHYWCVCSKTAGKLSELCVCIANKLSSKIRHALNTAPPRLSLFRVPKVVKAHKQDHHQTRSSNKIYGSSYVKYSPLLVRVHSPNGCRNAISQKHCWETEKIFYFRTSVLQRSPHETVLAADTNRWD